MKTHSLRVGDVVEVKSAEEILATLDEHGEHESLPFMPEMLPFLGRRSAVDKLTLKVCDTTRNLGSQEVPGTVFLGALRCDGSAHAECQAGCRLYWKEGWLRKLPPGTALDARPPEPTAALAALRDLALRNARKTAELDGKPEVVHRCQGTEAGRFSRRIHVLDPRVYIREYTSGNVSFGRFVRVTARATVEEPLRRFGLLRGFAIAGIRPPNSPPEPPLNLQPGEWVRVKSRAEIAKTLTAKGKNRGLWFDREQLPHCGNGKRYRVKARVRRIIDEATGRMIEFKNECLTLEGVICTGELVPGRFLCPREHTPYWRECWLERADPPDDAKEK